MITFQKHSLTRDRLFVVNHKVFLTKVLHRISGKEKCIIGMFTSRLDSSKTESFRSDQLLTEEGSRILPWLFASSFTIFEDSPITNGTLTSYIYIGKFIIPISYNNKTILIVQYINPIFTGLKKAICFPSIVQCNVEIIAFLHILYLFYVILIHLNENAYIHQQVLQQL